MKISKLFLALGFITVSFATHAQIGIGTNSPAASAQLEVSSTSKGFLPPRMTKAQRDAIDNPVSGLVIWCNNCGATGELQIFSEKATWTNLAGVAAAGVYTPTIGETYKGGKVAYVLQPGDSGYDASIPHGLIAASSDQSIGIGWANGFSFPVIGTATAIGTGLVNTNSIITIQGPTATNYAAGLARAYTSGGYTDWYLPSKDELNKLYLNMAAIGGFSFAEYWSSTEDVDNSQKAWGQQFGNGIQTNYNKWSSFRVRAIRAF